MLLCVLILQVGETEIQREQGMCVVSSCGGIRLLLVFTLLYCRDLDIGETSH